MIFKIETNKDFKKTRLNLKNENFIKKKIYNNFISSDKIKTIHSIKKNSITSNLYEIEEVNGKKKILRSFKSADIYKIKWAIKKINLIDNHYFFNLIKTINNKYIYTYKKNLYLLYDRLSGKIYSGKILEFYQILKKAIALHYEFNTSNKFTRKIIKNNFKNIENFIMQNNSLIGSIIKKKTVEFLLKNKEFILNQIKKIKIKKSLNDIQVVHADLNHANIIVYNSGITFLDIEDVRNDSLGVALSFLIFKLTRHSIYKNKITLKKFRNVILKKIIKILKNNNIELNRAKIMEYSMLRTFLDIELIISQIKNKNFENFYDLEKKLYNLIEIRYMFSNEHQI